MDWQPAIDVGGTFTKGALVGPDGELSAHRSVPTGARRGPASVVETIASLAVELLDAAAEANGRRPGVVGVAVPGVVDADRGVAVNAANFGWRDLPLARLLSERVGAAVALGHDVVAAGLAECRHGAGRSADPALVVPIGTGVAGALVRGRAAYRGHRGYCVELGHVPLAWSDEPCPCGGTGCAERLASAAAIGARYRRLNPQAAPNTDAAAVVARMSDGDPVAARVWDDAVRALGDVLVCAVRLLDPERIIVGGGLSKAGRTLLDPVGAHLGAHLTFQEVPELVPAALGSDAGVIGAAIFAQDSRHSVTQS